MAFRDSSTVVCETSRDAIRAAVGLHHELLQLPSVEISARVGLPRSAFPETTNGESSNASVASQAKINDYLVGTQLDEAIAAGQDLVVSYPFANGSITDWTQAEALWKHVIFKGLGLKRIHNESAVLLVIFPGLPRSAHERLSQIFFERFNVAGLSVLERPMAQLYAANMLSGVVVDIGRTHTDITPISDGFPLYLAKCTLPLGTDDCERFLAYLLRSNTSVTSVLGPPSSAEERDRQLLALARQIWTAGLIKVGQAQDAPEEEGVTDIAAVLVAGKEKAVIESGMKKRQNAKASAAEQARAKELEALDLVTLEFDGKELSVGKERHRFCDPLFNPQLLDGLPAPVEMVPGPRASALVPSKIPALQDLVGHSVGLTEADLRQYIWTGLFVTGDVSGKIKGLGTALQARLGAWILQNPDHHNDVQPRRIQILKVPEYFAEYRETGDGYAAFLGGSIVAKVAFNDQHTKNFGSKADYAIKGPKAVVEMSASLL